MSDDQKTKSRRDFLGWLAVTPSVALLGGGLLGGLGSGCSSTSGGESGRGGDSGTDAAGADAAGADAAGGDTGSADSGAGDAAGDAADAATCEATGSDVEGPFHLDGAPHRTELAPADEPGTRIRIEGTVYRPDCTTPLDGALLDVWHADQDGNYDDDTVEYRLRGQMLADAQGRYGFETIRPGNYPMSNTMRPAHIHFMVSKPGYQPLTTQLYFADDPYLAPNDPCTGCNSGDPTLIVALTETTDGGQTVFVGQFDIVLRRG